MDWKQIVLTFIPAHADEYVRTVEAKGDLLEQALGMALQVGQVAAASAAGAPGRANSVPELARELYALPGIHAGECFGEWCRRVGPEIEARAVVMLRKIITENRGGATGSPYDSAMVALEAFTDRCSEAEEALVRSFTGDTLDLGQIVPAPGPDTVVVGDSAGETVLSEGDPRPADFEV